MSIRRADGRKVKCFGKEQLKKRDALAKAKEYEARTGDYMRAYSCRNCNTWHIGHSNSRKPSFRKTRRKSVKVQRAEKRIRNQLRRAEKGD